MFQSSKLTPNKIGSRTSFQETDAAWQVVAGQVFGITGTKPQWQRCVSEVMNHLPSASAALYVREEFPESRRDEVYADLI